MLCQHILGKYLNYHNNKHKQFFINQEQVMNHQVQWRLLPLGDVEFIKDFSLRFFYALSLLALLFGVGFSYINYFKSLIQSLVWFFIS